MAIDENEPPRLDIAVTRVLPLPVLELLKSRHNIRINPDDRTLKPDELGPALAEPHPSWMERLETEWKRRYGAAN